MVSLPNYSQWLEAPLKVAYRNILNLWQLSLDMDKCPFRM